jgi:hypothetical protein
MSAPADRLLWQMRTATGDVSCRMLTCCSGAELQVVENDTITIRELYPDKSDLYERARHLRARFEAAGSAR